jgi:cytochrome P450
VRTLLIVAGHIRESAVTKLTEFDAETDPERASRILFRWLSDDCERADLYQCLREAGRVLKFQSRANLLDGVKCDLDPVYRQWVYLLGTRSQVEKALTTPAQFSNAPYKSVGDGTFMLGLDGGDHDAQRALASACLKCPAEIVPALAEAAFLAGAVQPLKRRNFDLADLSEQVALWFAGFLFGFAQADHVLLQESMRPAYHALSYQIVGRHFVSDSLALITAQGAMAKLVARVADLIDLYRAPVGRSQQDEYKNLKAELKELRAFRDEKCGRPLEHFEPALKRISADNAGLSDYTSNQLAVIVVGLIAGAISNIRAAASIVISELFRDSERFERAREQAEKAWAGDDVAGRQLKAMIGQALRLNPPAPFLTRKTLQAIPGMSIPAGAVVILAMGAATRGELDKPDRYVEDDAFEDALIFGGRAEDQYIHQCIGQHLAMPLIYYIVRQILRLPGLCQSLDPRTGKPSGLRKLWGVKCEEYPLEFNREEILRQSPLTVIMKVKEPVSVHAEALKTIIKFGAPIVEKKLNDAKLVHFASFLFIENDTKMMLQTIYDRDFDAYIEYFALQIGPLFDLVFAHIEDAPPSPVSEFPKEFVDTIRRYNVQPVAGYFYSAYPLAEVSMIRNQFGEST